MGMLGGRDRRASSSAFSTCDWETTAYSTESSLRGTPSTAPVQIDPLQEEAGTEAIWLRDIQYLALALTRTTSLLEKLWLLVLIAKNVLRSRDYHHLNKIATDDLYDNIIHSAMGSVMCAYDQGAWQGSQKRV